MAVVMPTLRERILDWRGLPGSVVGTVTPKGADAIEDVDGLWEPNQPHETSLGQSRRHEPVRTMRLRLDQVPALPAGSLFEFPPVEGGDVERWTNDGPELLQADYRIVSVVPSGPEED